jgi:hypothetical protein
VRDVTEFAKICKKILQTFKMKDTWISTNRWGQFIEKQQSLSVVA